jgi:hypothetical protein
VCIPPELDNKSISFHGVTDSRHPTRAYGLGGSLSSVGGSMQSLPQLSREGHAGSEGQGQRGSPRRVSAGFAPAHYRSKGHGSRQGTPDLPDSRGASCAEAGFSSNAFSLSN